MTEREAPRRARRTSDDDEPVLPQTSRDEHEAGWGDERTRRDRTDYDDERPPHHE